MDVACARSIAMGVDEQCFRYVYGGGAPHGVVFVIMVMTTIVGGGWGALVFLPFFAHAKTRRMVSALFLSFIVAAALGTGLKLAVGRVRPCYALTGVSALYGTPSGPSFPSGHALGSFCFAGFFCATAIRIARRDPAKRNIAWLSSVGAITFATIVALSRVYLGAHFPSDVAAGAVLGFAVGYAGSKAFEWHERVRPRASS